MDWKGNLKSKLQAWQHTLNETTILNSEISSVTRLIEDVEEPMTVMVFGEFNAGKSTFINAFLGEKVLTSDIIPTTAVLTKIKYGPSKKITGYFPDGKSKVFNEEALAGLSAEREGQEKDIRRKLYYLELQLPIDRLRNLTIVDTPGLNSGNPLHTKATEQFMDRADYAIWLFDYRNVGTDSERKALNQLNSYKIKTFGVINGIDRHDEEEEPIEEFVRFQEPRLHGLIDSLIPISALEALNGKIEKNLQMIEWSNWQQIENLFKKIESNTDEKTNRIFSRVLEHVKSVETILSAEKSKVPVPFYKHIIDQFVLLQYPKLHDEYNKHNFERQEAQRSFSKINQVFNDPVVEVSSTCSKIQQLSEVSPSFQGQSWQKKWEITCVEPYQSFLVQRDNYNKNLTNQHNEKKYLTQLWSVLSTKKYFKKGKLKKISHSQILFNESNEKLQKEYRQLLQNETGTKSHIGTYFKELENETFQLYEQLTQKITQGERDWKKDWELQEKELHKVSNEKVQIITYLREILEQYNLSLGLFFKESFSIIESIDSYQESKYTSEKIEALIPDMPIVEFNYVSQQFRAMKLLAPIENSKIEKQSFHYSALFQNNSSAPPSPLKFKVDQEIEKISATRKKLFGGLVAASIIGWGAVNIDFETLAEKVSGDTYSVDGYYEEEYESDYESDYDYEGSDESTEDFTFTTWNEDHIIRHIRYLHQLIKDQYRDELSYGFSDKPWATYSTLYDELIGFDRSYIDQVVINHVDVDQIQFQTTEYFEVGGSTREYKNIYTLMNYDSQPIVVEFFSEPIVQEVPVNEDALAQYMQEYRESYMYALNNGDFSYVEGYFSYNSTAYHELKDYVAEMAGKGFYFDFEYIDILSFTRSGPYYYEVNTDEQFVFTDDKGEKTQYNKQKIYTIYLPEEGKFEVEFIDTLDTKKTMIVEETVSYVDHYDIQMFMEQYYSDFNQAFNEYGFPYVENYYSVNGPEYENAKQYLNFALEKNMMMENQYFQVESIQAYDEQHYIVSAYSEDFYYYQDGSSDFKRVQTEFLLKVTTDGQLYIVDLPSLEILEEIES